MIRRPRTTASAIYSSLSSNADLQCMRQTNPSRDILPTASSSDRPPHHRPYSSLAAVFPSLLLSARRPSPAMQPWLPAALLCSSKRLARRDTRKSCTALRSRGCSPPTHLFVRCPFLVRCSSLRSNNGGSLIRPLLIVWIGNNVHSTRVNVVC